MRTSAYPRGVTGAQRSFAVAPGAEIPRSVFDRSHGHKTTFDSGYLVPIYCDEVLPGDTFNMQANLFARMATPLFPVMDNFFMDTFFFFVPMRLIWDNWEKFCGAQEDPGDSTDYELPVMTENVASNSLSDYLGIPIGVAGLEFASMFHRSYNLIWNEWFRDQNLQDSVVVDTDDGPDTSTDYVLLRRGKRHDYFSSCLPFAQKGDAVELPLGDMAPVRGIGTGSSASWSTSGTVHETGGIATVNPSNTADVYAIEDSSNSNYPYIYADLTSATASTINALRQAFQVQRMLERDARGGTRYTEVVLAHFGVISKDARLQRPEYLGGSSTRINVTPVANTSDISGAQNNVKSALGRLAGFAVAMDQPRFVKSFTEHGVILGLVNVRADLTYQQGLERMFNRRERFDLYWPALAHLGEQGVENREIYAQNTSDDDLVFGYQERYAEYRYKPSRVSGLFRSDASGSLDAWHLGLDFASLPLLNDTFIQDNPPFSRVVVVNTEPEFILDSYFSLRCARPMPTYSVPGLIDHF